MTAFSNYFAIIGEILDFLSLRNTNFATILFLGKKTKALALEIALINQEINFLLTADSELIPFIESM